MGSAGRAAATPPQRRPRPPPPRSQAASAAPREQAPGTPGSAPPLPAALRQASWAGPWDLERLVAVGEVEADAAEMRCLMPEEALPSLMTGKAFPDVAPRNLCPARVRAGGGAPFREVPRHIALPPQGQSLSRLSPNTHRALDCAPAPPSALPWGAPLPSELGLRTSPGWVRGRHTHTPMSPRPPFPWPKSLPLRGAGTPADGMGQSRRLGWGWGPLPCPGLLGGTKAPRFIALGRVGSGGQDPMVLPAVT